MEFLSTSTLRILVLLVLGLWYCTSLILGSPLAGLATFQNAVSIGIGYGSFTVKYIVGNIDGHIIVHMNAAYGANGYVAVGQAGNNYNTMVGGVCVIATSSAPNSIGLYSMWGTDQSSVGLISGSLDSLGIFNANVVQTSSSTVLDFYFNQTIGSAHMTLVPASGYSSLIFAVGSGMGLNQHVGRTSYYLTMPVQVTYPVAAAPAPSPGTNSGNGTNSGKGTQTPTFAGSGGSAQGAIPTIQLDNPLSAHFAFALIAFAFCFPIGATCAMCHQRGSPKTSWFFYHRSIQVCGCLCSIICFATGYSHVDLMSEHHFTQVHHILGLVLTIFVMLQVILGFLRWFLFGFPILVIYARFLQTERKTATRPSTQ